MENIVNGGSHIVNGESHSKEWKFSPNEAFLRRSAMSIRGMVDQIMSHIDDNGDDDRLIIPLGNGDPSVFLCFRIAKEAEDAVISWLRSAAFNGYPPHTGLFEARRAVAEYVSDLSISYKVSYHDVYLTSGCVQGMEMVNSVLARPGANLLLPRPGYPVYEERAAFSAIEVRFFDLLTDKGCEIDIEGVEALADENTVAMVIVNPGNPFGNVYTHQHLAQVAKIAKKLGILVISDEVYGHMTFGCNPFVPMGAFGHIAPVITLGSISKRWAVPGWRAGWMVINDPNGVLKKMKIVECMENYLDNTANPPTFVQAALPQILNMEDGFFRRTTDILRQTADVCYRKLKEIYCITCPNKPEGSMFLMVKLHLDKLVDIDDDVDFCCKLAREEQVIILPGCAVGLENWLRIMFAVEPTLLEDGLARLKSFCLKHKA